MNGDRELSSGRQSQSEEKLRKAVRRKPPPRAPKTDTGDILREAVKIVLADFAR